MDREGTTFKFRRIYAPLMALAAAMLVGYSLLNWLFVARSGLLPLNDNVVDCWLPLGASWILVLLFIQRTLGLLKSDAKGNLPFLYHALAVACVAGPTIVAQGYVRAATGEMTQVNDIGEVAAVAATKFYSAEHICLARDSALLHPVVSGGGRRSDYLVVDVYAVEPVCPGAAATAGKASVWIGLKEQTRLNNSLSDSEKEAKTTEFLKQADADFRSASPDTYRFLERVGRNADGKGLAAALQDAGDRVDVGSAVILIPHTEPFSQRTGNRLEWTLAGYAFGAVSWLVLLLVRPLDHARAKRLLEPAVAKEAVDHSIAVAFLLPRRNAYGLPILLDTNILVFVAMVLAGLGLASFDTQDLLAWGANYRPELHGLGYLRLISSQFIHAGFMHILNNMYGLLFAGIFLLPISGNAGLIACYLLCGIGGNVASAAIHPATVSVGASGAIFGMYGVLLVLLLLRDERLAEGRKLILGNVALFVCLNLFLGSISRGIDNAAHVGGLATGVLIGLVLFAARRARGPRAG